IERIKKNPLARALRLDKMTVAALEATLKLFLNHEALERQHPTYRMFALGAEQLRERAEGLAERARQECRAYHGLDVTVVEGQTQVGSGSVPTQTLPTWLVSVRPEGISAEVLARRLRCGNPPVFTRVREDRVLFDLRRIQPEEEDWVVAGIREALSS
ncbi:MAG: L-seryl-tRNA(Sec) selenium transferase, partial [Armatimonadota bacterium]